MNCKSWALLSFAALLLSSVASATTVYNDFGASQSFNLITGGLIGGSSSPTEQAIAASFQPALTVTLNSIDLAVAVQSGTTSFTVELTANSAGVPGTVLESYR